MDAPGKTTQGPHPTPYSTGERVTRPSLCLHALPLNDDRPDQGPPDACRPWGVLGIYVDRVSSPRRTVLHHVRRRVAILGVIMSGEESATRFSASEVNLLIYHYLKESGFLHTCFALRYEARLDDFPAAREPIVQPGQLLHYLQRGLMYVSTERQVEQVCDDAY